MNYIFPAVWCAGIVAVVIWQNKRLVDKERLPHLATMLGVLGTFVGVCFSLLGIQLSETGGIAELQKGASSLLDGLRFAFITSVFGMGTAVVLKIRQKDADASDPLEPLTERLDKIAQALHEGNARLVDQSEKLRGDFKAFEAEVSDQSVAALKTAMESLVEGFNAEINAQCAESFRQLNDAAGRLYLWQTAHAKQVEEQSKQLDAAIEALKASEEFMGAFVERSGAFSSIAERLDAALAELETREESVARLAAPAEELASTLKALRQGASDLGGEFQSFADSAASANQTLPQLKDDLSEASGTFQMAAGEISRGLDERIRFSSETLEASRQTFMDLQEAMGGLLNQSALFADAASRLERVVEEIAAREETLAAVNEPARELAPALKALSEGASNLGGELESFGNSASYINRNLPKIDENMSAMNRSVAESVKKIGESFDRLMMERSRAMNNLEKSLEAALKQSLITLGRQLADLSEKFVDDYAPLTEKLREIVQMAKDLE